MAKLPNLKSDKQIANDLRENLRQRGGITHWSFDSTARIISDTMTSEMARTNAESRRAFESIQISTAEGNDLDFIALEWAGIRRRGAAFSHVKANHKNLYFYAQNQGYGNTSNGTFGSINNGNPITIPRGTVISSSRAVQSSSAIVYETTEDVVLLPDEALKYISAKAVTMGAGMNCSDNSLRYHNFESYESSGFGSLKCNNRYPILSGSDRETDENLRFRVSQFMPAMVQNNSAKLRLSGLSIPGVEQVKILEGYFGIGTAAAVIFGMDHETTPALTRRFQDVLLTSQGVGTQVIAIPGVRVYFDFDIRVTTTRQLAENDKGRLRKTIHKLLLNGLKEYEKTDVIPLSKLAAVVANSSPMISGLVGRVDSPNYNKKSGFENVYIRRTNADEIPTIDRKRIVQNRFELKPEEICALGEVRIEFADRA